MAFDLVVPKKFLKGCMSSNLCGGSIHSWMFRGTKIACEILEGIANTFIVRLRNMMNGIET